MARAPDLDIVPDGFIHKVPEIGGQSDQRYSWSVVGLAPGASTLLLSRKDDEKTDRTVRFHAQAAICTFQIVSFTERALPIRENVQLGPFGIATIRTRGVIDVAVRNDSAANALTAGIHVLGDGGAGRIESVPPQQGTVLGLVEGALGVPGVWTDFVVAPALSGWQPGDRPDVELTTNGGLDFRWLTEAAAQVGFFSIAGVSRVIHPPQLRLQVRHPGGSSDTRTAVGTWRKA